MDSNIKVPITKVEVKRVNISWWDRGDKPRQLCVNVHCDLLSTNNKQVGEYQFSNEESFHDNKIPFTQETSDALKHLTRALEKQAVDAVLNEFNLIEAHPPRPEPDASSRPAITDMFEEEEDEDDDLPF